MAALEPNLRNIFSLILKVFYGFARILSIKSFTMVIFSVAQLFINFYKMMKYRSKIEIISHILAVANGSRVKRTRIMYKALLSFSQTKSLLPTLTEKGLLDFDQTSQTFKTTEKGLKFVQDYSELNELMKGLRENKITRYAESQIY